MHLVFLLLIVPLVYGDRTVFTNNGPIRGTTLEGKKIEAFLGIPYAEPPVGPLRFAKPVAKSSWDETYTANELPPACIQSPLEGFDFIIDRSKGMKEDCLYLNIWVPEGGKDVKPIMLFIHGGAFMLGSSNMKLYEGSTLSEHGDVIVASINYRVGTLGFFSGFIDEAPGSMGLYDQLMAIQWIKDNAKHFGGDPDNIVLFGESAGAFSVSLHMVSPLSKDLFKRGILQSGSAFHPMYSENNEALSIGSLVIAKLLGCADSDESLKEKPKEVVNCMKSLPAESFTEKDIMLLRIAGMLVPRVGDEFLPVSPIDAMRKGDFKDTEVLLGINRDEGPLLLSLFSPDIFGMFGSEIDASVFNETSSKEILRALIKMDIDNKVLSTYFGKIKEESKYTYLNAISDIVGDFIINCGAIFQAEFQSLRDTPVYFYKFDYRSPNSFYAEWMGVPHFDEIPYVFGNPMHSDFTEYEKEFSGDIMDMWTTFAKTGNPSIPGGLEWPRYTYEDPKYFTISQRDKIGVRPDDNRCETWRHFFRAVVDKR